MNLDETGCIWQALPNRGFNQNVLEGKRVSIG